MRFFPSQVYRHVIGLNSGLYILMIFGCSLILGASFVQALTLA